MSEKLAGGPEVRYFDAESAGGGGNAGVLASVCGRAAAKMARMCVPGLGSNRGVFTIDGLNRLGILAIYGVGAASQIEYSAPRRAGRRCEMLPSSRIFEFCVWQSGQFVVGISLPVGGYDLRTASRRAEKLDSWCETQYSSGISAYFATAARFSLRSLFRIVNDRMYAERAGLSAPRLIVAMRRRVQTYI